MTRCCLKECAKFDVYRWFKVFFFLIGVVGCFYMDECLRGRYRAFLGFVSNKNNVSLKTSFTDWVC